MSRTTIYRSTENDEWEIDVRYTVTPGCAASWDHPGDPDEIDIESATLHGAPVTLTDDEVEKILADHEWDDGPDPDDARDRLIDDRLTGAA